MEQKENVAHESARLATLNLDPDDINFSLDRVIEEFGRKYLSELFEHSPYKEKQMEAVAAGDLDNDERLSFEADGWAVDALIYKTRPVAHGLLTEAAKECLKNDFMAPPQLVEIFNQSREGYTRAAEDFNKAVETASPEKLLSSFHSLFDHAARYDFKKLEQNGITQKQIAATLIDRYGQDMENAYAAYKETEQTIKQPQLLQINAPEAFHPRKAPMLSEEPNAQPPAKIREAPMLPQQSTATPHGDRNNYGQQCTGICV